MGCQPLKTQLSPEGLATVIKQLVTSGLWFVQHRVGRDKKQLPDRVLNLKLVQQLSKDHAFAMMQALAELGYSVTPVISMVPSAVDISSEQVATLLRLTMDNSEMVDVRNLTCRNICAAAADLEPDFVLEVGW
jgi:hypothetical protein